MNEEVLETLDCCLHDSVASGANVAMLWQYVTAETCLCCNRWLVHIWFAASRSAEESGFTFWEGQITLGTQSDWIGRRHDSTLPEHDVWPLLLNGKLQMKLEQRARSLTSPHASHGKCTGITLTPPTPSINSVVRTIDSCCCRVAVCG